ncbi:MOSC domain-containing protein [Gorillibacterium sp. sgz5001074]|uniref:MOSC domain-containing protein n=1 Tax=Gorillibacterium sp. sgz5001074 TaxID=3446695 RepID=UPI003F680875
MSHTEYAAVVSLQAGKPKIYSYEGRSWTTALFKEPLEGAAMLGNLGFETDGQADLEHHGGPDKAVCVYCSEHYPYWQSVLGRELPQGAFGENVTLSGWTEKEVCIGDTFRLGEALVELSQPRQPCYKLGYRYERPDMPLLVQQAGYTGWYFRVLQEGLVGPGDRLERVKRSPYGITVAEANRIMYGEKEGNALTAQLLNVPELSASWRNMLQKRMTQKDL